MAVTREKLLDRDAAIVDLRDKLSDREKEYSSLIKVFW